MNPLPRGEITVLLNRLADGDQAATDRLAEVVYAELRRIAKRVMAAERPNHTLAPTALAGEAYVNLVDLRDQTWQNRSHFFAVAARAMRRLLVDYGRRRRAQKRGGAVHSVDVDASVASVSPPADEVLVVNEALDRLAAVDPRQARIVELRYFGGLTEEETAEVLQVSVRTVKRDWAVARAWLYAELTRRADGNSSQSA